MDTLGMDYDTLQTHEDFHGRKQEESVILKGIHGWLYVKVLLLFKVYLSPHMTWHSFVKTHIKFQRSLVKSRSVSNMEHSTKPGRVRCKLNLCVGSPVTEAYRKLDNVLESSWSYVRDGWRLCVKHREFFQNDNGKKTRK